MEYYGIGPQPDKLKNSIDRAIQDLFLSALRGQKDEFILIFGSIEQIKTFTDRMIKFWEGEEYYEVCSEIITLRKKMAERWEETSQEGKDGNSDIKKWLLDPI
jgi:hypothetical protein